MLRSGLLACGLLAAGAARAQSTTYFPGPAQFSTVLFEDRWPDAGDFDLNDAAVRVHQRRRGDMAGGVTEVVLDVTVQALGASQCSGLALRLPAAPTAVVVQRVVGTAGAVDGAPWGTVETLTPDPTGDGGAVVALSGDLRAELCEGQTGFLNTDEALPTATCRPLALRVLFDPPTATVPDTPGDLFLYRCDDPGLQVHRSTFYGVVGGPWAVDAGRFGDGADGSDGPGGSRWYVDTRGVPFALLLGDAVYGIAREREAIDRAFPAILGLPTNTPGSATFWHAPDPAYAYDNGAAPPPLPVHYLDADNTPREACLAGGGAFLGASDACDCTGFTGGRWNGTDCAYDAEVAACQADALGDWDPVTDACACAPTHDWTGAACAEVGTPAAPGLSCDAILDRGVDHGSTTYTIDPDGTGTIAAYTVWCDMSLHDGGWTRVLVHAGQGGSSFYWNNSPTWYTTRTATGSVSSTTSDTLSYAFSDVPASEIMLVRTGNPSVGVVRTLPAAMAGQTVRALMEVVNNTHTYGPTDGALNGKTLGFGNQVYTHRRSIYADLTQSEMLALLPATSAADYSGGASITIGAYDRAGFPDPWHVQYGSRVAFIDNGGGNGNPCSKITSYGYSQLNGPHVGGHDCCTATSSAESWLVYVR